ncbi:MAG: hypothetical protein JNM57_13210 [Cyclobacteriaceae bacterium]|nr:hypothetical protein [Cyclobacteriaceae bacterium]
MKSAFREVLLIFVGITLSLFFNDWYNDLNEHKIERRLLTEIKSNIEQDIAIMKICDALSRETIQASTHTLQFLRSGETLNESVTMSFGLLPSVGLITFNRSGYESLKSLGIHLLRNDSIRILLTRYVESQHVLSYRVQLIINHNVNNLYPTIMSEFEGYKVRQNSIPMDDRRLRQNQFFKGAIDRSIQLHELLLRDLQQPIQDCESLIRLIDKEIVG